MLAARQLLCRRALLFRRATARVAQIGAAIEENGVEQPGLVSLAGLGRKLLKALPPDDDPNINEVNDIPYHELYDRMRNLDIYVKPNLKERDLKDQVRAILAARADVRSKARASVENFVKDW